MSKKQGPPAADDSAARSRKSRFSEQFKRDAVRLVSEEKYTFRAAAAAVNVSEKSLRDWHAQFTPKPLPCGEDATFSELREENKRLRQQLRRAEMEREILSLDLSIPWASCFHTHSALAAVFCRGFRLRGFRRSWLICLT